MKSDKIHREIFKKGSTTYFNASLFFPPFTRRRVSVLYAFARRADDFVDAVPQDREGFSAFVGRYRAAAAGGNHSCNT